MKTLYFVLLGGCIITIGLASCRTTERSHLMGSSTSSGTDPSTILPLTVMAERSQQLGIATTLSAGRSIPVQHDGSKWQVAMNTEAETALHHLEIQLNTNQVSLLWIGKHSQEFPDPGTQIIVGANPLSPDLADIAQSRFTSSEQILQTAVNLLRSDQDHLQLFKDWQTANTRQQKISWATKLISNQVANINTGRKPDMFTAESAYMLLTTLKLRQSETHQVEELFQLMIQLIRIYESPFIAEINLIVAMARDDRLQWLQALVDHENPSDSLREEAAFAIDEITNE